jgi:hypothetical protein
MSGITIHEFDTLVSEATGIQDSDGLRIIPARVFAWLEAQCLQATEMGEASWLRLRQRSGF